MDGREDAAPTSDHPNKKIKLEAKREEDQSEVRRVMVLGHSVAVTPRFFVIPHVLIDDEFRNVAGPALHKVLVLPYLFQSHVSFMPAVLRRLGFFGVCARRFAAPQNSFHR